MVENLIIPSEIIVSKIYIIRNKKVMLDRDLAELYGVMTGNLNLAVRRNLKRFPEDFMFQLNKEEFKNLILQIETSSWGGIRKSPFVFTEQGVAMLSSVLNSDRAINVNIQIIRTFVKIRELLATNEILQKKIMAMEDKYDSKIKKIFDILGLLLEDKNLKKKRNTIGFIK
ncbi:MAG: DNA-binding protein [Candidatus Staskawiczbacteria bacterium RIFOXYB1_FULL_32_11]|uniref:DNA-binding protein n=1 Tax=Candidatus Staskawiczbacteria bacterium RIFOXYD1_FULL_32_13 TaxID=1802234 RepID=A0A1G2JTD8_9BACT|nr:MAG: KilA-N, DNA-binding domain protein [Parcubacteria group bacterium GW2011_GWC2_32_10]OGZ77967.1 MAG: DNA-binding protein [Candidatus Staskawiczbacteria bacterium RIFOXYA2_FULL_32_7]OGZ80941.1 MAG: DNA-binding protein [Candidatus Staskawiczbacteria bacterium RIFOXYB1_FULL_32_11]OGZ87909.1 MAG: DNA-binding protein [Candidatus Staskawiczbacteria bacterium RIFOXYC2_FULL_32_10]OGZ89711.1 MAG: DNA-binding protein [Candidatus Staskawiczbacteria bacterium RIFOXYD1_FULL_32_13]